MEMGYDGVFVDLAGPTVECHGPKFGKHTHPNGRTNTEAHEDLLREIYAEVKRHGEGRAVIQNTCVSIMPSHWPYTDAQMLEAFPFGEDSTDLRQPWPELQWTTERNVEAVRKGKVVVLLPYFGRGEPDAIQRAALLSYAYAQLSGFLWADAFGLRGLAENEGFAKELYAMRLGRPTGGVTSAGEALYRTFADGTVALNPSPWPARVEGGGASVDLGPQEAHVIGGER